MKLRCKLLVLFPLLLFALGCSEDEPASESGAYDFSMSLPKTKPLSTAEQNDSVLAMEELEYAAALFRHPKSLIAPVVSASIEKSLREFLDKHCDTKVTNNSTSSNVDLSRDSTDKIPNKCPVTFRDAQNLQVVVKTASAAEGTGRYINKFADQSTKLLTPIVNYSIDGTAKVFSDRTATFHQRQDTLDLSGTMEHKDLGKLDILVKLRREIIQTNTTKMRGKKIFAVGIKMPFGWAILKKTRVWTGDGKSTVFTSVNGKTLSKN